jgi:hypothetical protein
MLLSEARMNIKIEVLNCARHRYAPGFTCMLVKQNGEIVLEIINEDGICLGTVSGPKVPEVWLHMTGEVL